MWEYYLCVAAARRYRRRQAHFQCELSSSSLLAFLKNETKMKKEIYTLATACLVCRVSAVALSLSLQSSASHSLVAAYFIWYYLDNFSAFAFFSLSSSFIIARGWDTLGPGRWACFHTNSTHHLEKFSTRSRQHLNSRLSLVLVWFFGDGPSWKALTTTHEIKHDFHIFPPSPQPSRPMCHTDERDNSTCCCELACQAACGWDDALSAEADVSTAMMMLMILNFRDRGLRQTSDTNLSTFFFSSPVLLVFKKRAELSWWDELCSKNIVCSTWWERRREEKKGDILHYLPSLPAARRDIMLIFAVSPRHCH